MSKEIKNIINKAVNIERWAEKSNLTYSFLEEDEIIEITDKIISSLEEEGYKIVKVL